jgi:hypothetical protein
MVDGISMWHLNLPRLPFDNYRSIVKESLNCSSSVLAAIRDAYIFVYAEAGKATLVSVESGELLRQVPGNKFVLSPLHVLSVDHGGKKKGLDITVVNAATGKTSPTVTTQRNCLSMDAYGDQPWHHDDEAYADFADIVKHLPPTGPRWPAFTTRAETYWGFGHAMIDSSRMVLWARESASQFEIKLGSSQLN